MYNLTTFQRGVVKFSCGTRKTNRLHSGIFRVFNRFSSLTLYFYCTILDFVPKN